MKTATRQPLTEGDLAALERDSWIDRATVEAFGCYRVSSAEGAQLVGRKNHEDYSGLVFPAYWPGTADIRESYLRRDHPPLEQQNGSLKPKQKYLAPAGRKNLLLFGPGEPADALTDTSLPILLNEGVKKLLVGHRFSRISTRRFLACAITGVSNFRGTIGKTTDATGARVSITGVIPDLDRVTWTARLVFLLYDSDAAKNPKVWAAREALAEELRTRGARVLIMYMPVLDGLEKTGFDDLLAQWGPERVEAWLHTGATGVTEVEDPEPITLDSMVVPAFTTSLIPAMWLREMIAATAAETETPVELALLLSLAVVATAVQKKYVIEPQQNYTEPLNIWALVFLDSSNRKTAVLKKVTAPLLAFEKQMALAMAPEIQQATAALHLAEERIKHLRQKAAKAQGIDFDVLRQELFDAEAALPEVPRNLRLWCQDITPEQLGQLLADHGEKMALLSDEGGIFETLAGRYSKGIPNFDVFCQAYSGSSVRVDRGSRPSVFLDSPALTMGLSPQLSVLKDLTKISDFRGKGLLARPLYALPQSTLGYRTNDSLAVPAGVQEAYSHAIQDLLTLPMHASGQPHLLHCTVEAHQEWKAFQQHVEEGLRDGGSFEHIRDWAGKLPGSVARLAGVLHCAQYADGEPQAHLIDLPTMEAALELGALLERHALVAFSVMAVDSTVDAARKVWNWVLREQQGTFSRRDCQQALRGSFSDIDAIQPAFEVLMKRDYLFLLPDPIPKPVGRSSLRYRVNHRIAKEWTHGMA